ncbi:MAG: hypothetical protein KUG64_10790 [Cycloclasticus sp.]|nr:hypothetical protein [Cycloclasticus sp.]
MSNKATIEFVEELESDTAEGEQLRKTMGLIGEHIAWLSSLGYDEEILEKTELLSIMDFSNAVREVVLHEGGIDKEGGAKVKLLIDLGKELGMNKIGHGRVYLGAYVA